MINDLVNGIAKALYEEFGTIYTIYTENTESGIEEPCFIINVLSALSERSLMDRFNKTIPLCVQYFPGTIDKFQEMNDITERLEICLEFVEQGTALVHGYGMNSEVIDGILNFNVTYSYRTMQHIDEIQMEDVEYTETVKGVS